MFVSFSATDLCLEKIPFPRRCRVRWPRAWVTLLRPDREVGDVTSHRQRDVLSEEAVPVAPRSDKGVTAGAARTSCERIGCLVEILAQHRNLLYPDTAHPPASIEPFGVASSTNLHHVFDPRLFIPACAA